MSSYSDLTAFDPNPLQRSKYRLSAAMSDNLAARRASRAFKSNGPKAMDMYEPWMEPGGESNPVSAVNPNDIDPYSLGHDDAHNLAQRQKRVPTAKPPKTAGRFKFHSEYLDDVELDPDAEPESDGEDEREQQRQAEHDRQEQEEAEEHRRRQEAEQEENNRRRQQEKDDERQKNQERENEERRAREEEQERKDEVVRLRTFLKILQEDEKRRRQQKEDDRRRKENEDREREAEEERKAQAEEEKIRRKHEREELKRIHQEEELERQRKAEEDRRQLEEEEEDLRRYEAERKAEQLRNEQEEVVRRRQRSAQPVALVPAIRRHNGDNSRSKEYGHGDGDDDGIHPGRRGGRPRSAPHGQGGDRRDGRGGAGRDNDYETEVIRRNQAQHLQESGNRRERRPKSADGDHSQKKKQKRVLGTARRTLSQQGSGRQSGLSGTLSNKRGGSGSGGAKSGRGSGQAGGNSRNRSTGPAGSGFHRNGGATSSAPERTKSKPRQLYRSPAPQPRPPQEPVRRHRRVKSAEPLRPREKPHLPNIKQNKKGPNYGRWVHQKVGTIDVKPFKKELPKVSRPEPIPRGITPRIGQRNPDGTVRQPHRSKSRTQQHHQKPPPLDSPPPPDPKPSSDRRKSKRSNKRRQ